VRSFSDGKSAYEFLSSNEIPSLVVMEWKLPALNGPALLQRIRLQLKLDIPLIIYSSVVGDGDRLLLREMGVTEVISKPMYQKLLMEEIKTVILNEKSGTDIERIESKIRVKLRQGDFGGAQALLDVVQKNDKIPAFIKAQLQAETLCFKGNYVEAKEFAINALNEGGENLMLLDLLGKILLNLKEFEFSKKFLDKAAKLSPNNIERLCALAEVNGEIGDNDGLQTRLDQAKKIDKESEYITESEAAIAITSGNIKLAQNLMKTMNSSESLVARLNNKAVSLVNQEKASEAVNLYQKALNAISIKSKSLSETVYYNLGLAFAKSGELEKATMALQHVNNDTNRRVSVKSKSLLQRIKKCVDRGESLVLKTADNKKLTDESFLSIEIVSSPNELPIAKDALPGDICCHLIYQIERSPDSHVLELLLKHGTTRRARAS
ncbi:MAG: response regulator, partial [Oligoflexales bacterium]|nr:response regulator [Oligoflexales bacterium]